MKTMYLTAMMGLVLSVASCRQHDYRTIVIHVPEMRNPACAEVVVKAVSTQNTTPPRIVIPVEDIQVSLETRNVTVRYESLDRSLKNIEFAIADAGFRANDVPANEKAKAALPAECLK